MRIMITRDDKFQFEIKTDRNPRTSGPEGVLVIYAGVAHFCYSDGTVKWRDIVTDQRGSGVWHESLPRW